MWTITTTLLKTTLREEILAEPDIAGPMDSAALLITDTIVKALATLRPKMLQVLAKGAV